MLRPITLLTVIAVFCLMENLPRANRHRAPVYAADGRGEGQGQKEQNAKEKIESLLKEADELSRGSRFAEMAEKAGQAVKLAEMAGDKALLARSLTSYGTACFFLGRQKEAIAPFELAERLYGEIGDLRQQSRILGNLGVVFGGLRQSDRFFDCVTRSIAIARKAGDRSVEAFGLMRLCTAYLEFQEFERAEATADEAQRLARELKNRDLESRIIYSRAMLERVRGRLQSALDHFAQSLAIQREMKRPELIASNLYDYALTYLELGDRVRALELFNESLELARGAKVQIVEGSALGGVGLIHLRNGKYVEAIEELSRSRAIVRQVGDPIMEVRATLGLARAERALGRNEAALADYRAALVLLRGMRASAVPNDSLRAGLTTNRQMLECFSETVDLLVELRRETEALQVAEDFRARAFLDQLAETRVDARQDLTEEQREREDRILAQLSRWQKQLRQEGLPPDEERRIRVEMDAAERELEIFQLDLRRTSPRYAGVQYPASLDARQIQQRLLDSGTTLIEFLLGEQRSFVWVVTPERTTLGTLPSRREITDLVNAYRESLARRPTTLTLRRALTEYEDQSRKLYETLLRPVEGAFAAGRRLIIVPDGVLAYLPFETLRQQEEALVSRFSISYAPSATALAALREHRAQPRRQQKMLLAFGDPSYGTEANTNRSERGYEFTRLPYTKAEVEAIGASWPEAERRIYLGDAAREEAVKVEPLDEYRYLHFAAHGLLNEERPARSGIALSFIADSKEDGLLQVGEIMRLKLRADLVTLSACGTGLGKLRDGEGFIGVARAFFYAGAGSVVGSLWNVNDAATAQMMKTFYQNLQRGMAKDEALGAAKLALVKGKSPLWRHPYFWAPFVVIGERR